MSSLPRSPSERQKASTIAEFPMPHVVRKPNRSSQHVERFVLNSRHSLERGPQKAPRPLHSFTIFQKEPYKVEETRRTSYATYPGYDTQPSQIGIRHSPSLLCYHPAAPFWQVRCRRQELS